MILSISFQFELFITALFIGFFLGLCYDFLRIIRIYFTHNNVAIGVEDIVYWSFMSVIIFMIILYQNDGEIRVFFILTMLLGMLLYRISISNIVIKLINNIIKLVIKIVKILYAPIKMIIRPIKALFIEFCKNIRVKVRNKIKK